MREHEMRSNPCIIGVKILSDPNIIKYIQKGDDLLASDDAIQLLALLILVFLSAFFSSAETSLTTVNTIKLQALAEEGSRLQMRTEETE